MIPYFVIYGLVVSGIFICFLGDPPVRRAAQQIYFFLIILALAVFASLRSPNVDRDFQNYVLWFDLIKSGDAPLMAWLRDPAFAIFSWMASRIGLSYSAVEFVYAFLGLLAMAGFALAAVGSRWATLFFYLIFCENFTVLEMTEIRAAVAIPLMALSLYLASQGRRRRAIATFLVGLVFHFSIITALPFLVLILTGTRFRTRAWLVALAVLGAVASLTMRSVIDLVSGLYRISEFVNAGSNINDTHVVSWLALADRLAVIAPALVLWKRLNLHQRMAVIGCGAGLTLFAVFSLNAALAIRLLYIFDVYWLLTMMTILEKLQGQIRIFYVAFLAILGFSLFCKSLIYVEPYSVSRDWDARLMRPGTYFMPRNAIYGAQVLLASQISNEATAP